MTFLFNPGKFSLANALFAVALCIFPGMHLSAEMLPEAANLGLPDKTAITKLGDEIFVNGIPTKMIGIAVPDSIKNTAAFFLAKWTHDGWQTNIERNGDYVIVSAFNKQYQKVATLTKTGEDKTEGSISLTDMPARMASGKGPDFEAAKHLPKPINTMVLNEVLIRDETGESIMTTMGNFYDVQQNTAYYRERMFELGWKEQKYKSVGDGKGTILVFSRPGKEATFTIFLQNRQTFVTVNWLNK